MLLICAVYANGNVFRTGHSDSLARLIRWTKSAYMKKTPLKKKKASDAKPALKVARKPAKKEHKKINKNEPDIRITSTGGGLE